MRFKNNANGYVETSRHCWLWCLLFGPFYLALKGAYAHAVIGACLGTVTLGFSWFVYPFFAKGIVANVYSRKGWTMLYPDARLGNN